MPLFSNPWVHDFSSDPTGTRDISPVASAFSRPKDDLSSPRIVVATVPTSAQANRTTGRQIITAYPTSWTSLSPGVYRQIIYGLSQCSICQLTTRRLLPPSGLTSSSCCPPHSSHIILTGTLLVYILLTTSTSTYGLSNVVSWMMRRTTLLPFSKKPLSIPHTLLGRLRRR